jgi:hypothetical protein
MKLLNKIQRGFLAVFLIPSQCAFDIRACALMKFDPL